MIDLCKGLIMQGKKMREVHIGYILREVIKVNLLLNTNQAITDCKHTIISLGLKNFIIWRNKNGSDGVT